jgi:hypothetical protein
MGGGAAAQWWPINRLWLRAGPANAAQRELSAS